MDEYPQRRFMDLLGGDSPMINHKRRKVVYIGQATQLLDFTTMVHIAAYTAAVAADLENNRYPEPTWTTVEDFFRQKNKAPNM
jgi:hypothetical protein